MDHHQLGRLCDDSKPVTGLDLDGMGRTGNGAICGQWGGSGSANQQWQIVE
jgi:hypothetical protein